MTKDGRCGIINEPLKKADALRKKESKKSLERDEKKVLDKKETA